MGAFGSCLGVGRPMRPGANPRLLASSMVNVDASFGSNAGSGRQGIGKPNYNGVNSANGPAPKLYRQSSALSSNHQQQAPPLRFNQRSSQAQLIDFEGGTSEQNSHMICNRGPPTDPLNYFLEELRTDCKILLALYDYEAKSKEDLSFHKGEHLETTSRYMQNEWWLARSKTTKKIGYVPNNHVGLLKTLGAEPWYFGKIGRGEAEHRLRMPENKDGAFIIRISDSHGPNLYSLSLKHDDEVKHYRIVPYESGGFYIDKKFVFSTIHDLVLHYSKMPDGLCINLREPCVSQTPQVPFDAWEIDRAKITLSEELGRGQFGQVFRGLMVIDNTQVHVAVKTLRKGSMDPKDFLAEAQIMKKMQHPNLVKLHAVCTQKEPVYIITELMSRGALINYLQTDGGKNLTIKEYIHMAAQIANGMSYIEKEKYVHRDLAARNILVDDHNVCKIADFGLARFIKETEYEARAGARFPIKWTAPEAANYSKFTIKSDVWSFGIVLYEIITKGGTPYPDMTNAEVLSRIDKGYRMPKPPNCEPKYYSIMLGCWNKEPEKRPTFHTLYNDLNDYFMSEEQYREASQFRADR